MARGPEPWCPHGILVRGGVKRFGAKASGSRCMNEVEKLDNVTWYGHCVIHLMAALNDLPDQAKLEFCRDLERFIRRQERDLQKAAA